MPKRDPVRAAVLADRASLRAEYRCRIASLECMAAHAPGDGMAALVPYAQESARNVEDHLERIEAHWRAADRKAKARKR